MVDDAGVDERRGAVYACGGVGRVGRGAGGREGERPEWAGRGESERQFPERTCSLMKGAAGLGLTSASDESA